MNRLPSFCLVAAGMLAGLVTLSAPVPAAAEDCVKLVGHAASAEKLSMDPAVNTSIEDLLYLNNIYEALVDLDTSFRPVPVLAESWQPSADGRQWTFRLRRGVKFHDGRDLTSADVVYSFKRLLDPALASGARATLAFLDPEGIEAIDSHTVRFTTKNPVVEFPVLIRNKFTLIVPNGMKREDFAKRGIGTGPFVQETFTLGAPFNVLKRNPRYWQPGLPKAECVRVAIVGEPVTRTAAILSGDADVVVLVDMATVPTLAKNPKVQMLRTGGATAMVIAMWVDTPPFNDRRVRQALKLVVDRKVINDTAMLGMGELGNDSPVPPSNPLAYSAEIPKRDVARAKALLAEAGHPGGLQVDLYSSTNLPGMLAIAQAFVQMAADAGIKVNLIQAPSATFWSETWLKVPFMTSGWAARPPAEALAVAYRKNARWPETHWFRDDYDALLDKADGTADAGRRTALLKQAQRMLVDEGGAIIPVFAPVVAAMRAECSGYAPHPSLNYFDFRQVACKR